MKQQTDFQAEIQRLSKAERRKQRRATPKYRNLHASRERIRVESFNNAFAELRSLLPVSKKVALENRDSAYEHRLYLLPERSALALTRRRPCSAPNFKYSMQSFSTKSRRLFLFCRHSVTLSVTPVTPKETTIMFV
ncbi:hypothetical protein L596_003307 [Steinernema carpocapsae]|uniref:BHLH domain-containing protein n=1 Tax=Steinernema carpocapsae TaxID=34508 RepID=A0A4U8US94_STECR|nr:hypothetical protein L596_003307 [Steinernema carpocapsae]